MNDSKTNFSCNCSDCGVQAAWNLRRNVSVIDKASDLGEVGVSCRTFPGMRLIVFIVFVMSVSIIVAIHFPQAIRPYSFS
ncbi:unnamed protein product [Cylicocyclus nassatus]|uniref:Uncharacterized protein n=1 Tax=Cylicocyclus nassatus TaxID=53992 RepID=A0AA36HA54_CYLNA|nr:unnamed protein product [Cylicocyclus nassatus]